MSFRPTIVGVSNPLRSLPSALAMHDVQPRFHRALANARVDEAEVIAALQLDPLAVLRGLRAAHAPVFRESPALPSVNVMVQRLGLANSRRLLACAPVTVAASSPLRTLWRHSIATAVAAADLATQSGLMDPNAAYLIGLVGDLAQWLAALRTSFPHPSAAPSPGDCVAQWQLPATLATQVRAARTSEADDPMVWMPTDVTGLLQAARRLANLAGFTAPRQPEQSAAQPVAADRSELDAVDRLQRRVAGALGAFGLEGSIAEPAPCGMELLPSLLAGERAGALDEAVLGILGCSRSDSYRGIVTALTSAALRYGDYDRAFYAKWLPKNGTMTLRSKADASSRRIQQWRYLATPAEGQALQRALSEDCPVRLESAVRNATGLLAGLSADELLAVPLNGAMQQPSFLLLDRSLTLRPIEIHGDHAIAVTLGRTGSLLNENLLLRRRRQRAQKFALTDPLTRLFNRRMGLLALEQEIARSERSARPVTVLMCDLDHFKQLNDALGHLQGDHALRATADVLRQTLRKGDTICRHGGEEFLVVLPDTSPADASVLAARLFTAVQSRGEELGLPITISVGLTAYRPGDTVEAILQRADHALYASKGYGRNRFSVDLEPGEEPITVRHQADGTVVPGR